MATLATLPENLLAWNNSAIAYGTIANNPQTWDAHMMYGCVCNPMYMGYDCSQRVCPSGPDPENVQREFQIIYCRDIGHKNVFWVAVLYCTVLYCEISFFVYVR